MGVRMVGFVMSVWGLTTMLSSALLGYAARYTGRRFLCFFAFFIDFAILMLLLLWKPHLGSSSLPVFFCVVSLMGLVDGIWAVQCSGEKGNIFNWFSFVVVAVYICMFFVCSSHILVLSM
jgi:hypothetical protein